MYSSKSKYISNTIISQVYIKLNILRFLHRRDFSL